MPLGLVDLATRLGDHPPSLLGAPRIVRLLTHREHLRLPRTLRRLLVVARAPLSRRLHRQRMPLSHPLLSLPSLPPLSLPPFSARPILEAHLPFERLRRLPLPPLPLLGLREEALRIGRLLLHARRLGLGRRGRRTPLRLLLGGPPTGELGCLRRARVGGRIRRTRRITRHLLRPERRRLGRLVTLCFKRRLLLRLERRLPRRVLGGLGLALALGGLARRAQRRLPRDDPALGSLARYALPRRLARRGLSRARLALHALDERGDPRLRLALRLTLRLELREDRNLPRLRLLERHISRLGSHPPRRLHLSHRLLQCGLLPRGRLSRSVCERHLGCLTLELPRGLNVRQLSSHRFARVRRLLGSLLTLCLPLRRPPRRHDRLVRLKVGNLEGGAPGGGRGRGLLGLGVRRLEGQAPRRLARLQKGEQLRLSIVGLTRLAELAEPLLCAALRCAALRCAALRCAAHRLDRSPPPKMLALGAQRCRLRLELASRLLVACGMLFGCGGPTRKRVKLLLPIG